MLYQLSYAHHAMRIQFSVTRARQESNLRPAA
jgi:hypothetical protein